MRHQQLIALAAALSTLLLWGCDSDATLAADEVRLTVSQQSTSGVVEVGGLALPFDRAYDLSRAAHLELDVTGPGLFYRLSTRTLGDGDPVVVLLTELEGGERWFSAAYINGGTGLAGGGGDRRWRGDVYAFLLNASGRPFADTVTVRVGVRNDGSYEEAFAIVPGEHTIPRELVAVATGVDLDLLPPERSFHNEFSLNAEADVTDPQLVPGVVFRVRPTDYPNSYDFRSREGPGAYSGLTTSGDGPLTEASSFRFFLLRKPGEEA